MVLNTGLTLGFEHVASRTSEERDCLVALGCCATARVDDGIDAWSAFTSPSPVQTSTPWVRLIPTVS
jgi:hypothetical protein